MHSPASSGWLKTVDQYYAGLNSEYIMVFVRVDRWESALSPTDCP
jgi:hypothetical protein